MPDAAKTQDAYLPQPASIIARKMLTPTEAMFDVRLESGASLNHRPGQFVEVTVPGFGEVPISISSSPDHGGNFQLVVRKVGHVTAAMHDCRQGAMLGVRGPYGTSFPVDGAMQGRDVLFVAGGIGLAPLRSAIRYVLEHREAYARVLILYGTKTPAERLFVDELAQWAARDGIEMLETVDRPVGPWSGHVGVITTLIPRLKIDPAKTIVAACGPPVMYKFLIISLFDAGLGEDRIYLSLERRMKCGIGKCGHCQVNGLYACTDGPVFRYTDILHVQEAI